MSGHQHTWDPNEHLFEASRDSQTILQCKSKDENDRACTARITLGDHLQRLGYEQNDRALKATQSANQKMFYASLVANFIALLSVIIAAIALK